MQANRERDLRKTNELLAKAWRVMTIWQCSLNEPEVVLTRIEDFLRSEIRVAEASGTVDLPRGNDA